MSTRDDATLSAEERAAFSRIEAQAIADDPSLGASLVWLVGERLKSTAARLGREMQRPFVGPVAVVVGMVAVVAGLAAAIGVAVAGLVLVVLGAVPVAETIRRRAELASVRRDADT